MILTSSITNTKVKRKLYGIAGACITLAIPFLLHLNNADNHIEREQSLCPFKLLTGLPCPGCGITKSLVYFYQGEFFKSIRYHILGPFVIAFSIVTIVVLLTELSTKKEYFSQWLYNKKLAYGLGIFLAVYHLSRLIIFIAGTPVEEILRQSIWK